MKRKVTFLRCLIQMQKPLMTAVVLTMCLSTGNGMLDGIAVWGDVAYDKGMLFSPDFWRRHFKPGVKAMVDFCHEQGVPFMSTVWALRAWAVGARYRGGSCL